MHSYRKDILDIDPLKLTNKELKSLCELAMCRAMRLLKEIVGPNLPNGIGHSKSSIEKDGKIFEKKINPIDFPIELRRDIEIKEGFMSDEYIFWGCNYSPLFSAKEKKKA